MYTLQHARHQSSEVCAVSLASSSLSTVLQSAKHLLSQYKTCISVHCHLKKKRFLCSYHVLSCFPSSVFRHNLSKRQRIDVSCSICEKEVKNPLLEKGVYYKAFFVLCCSAQQQRVSSKTPLEIKNWSLEKHLFPLKSVLRFWSKKKVFIKVKKI